MLIGPNVEHLDPEKDKPRTGWMCPKCQRTYSPDTEACTPCGNGLFSQIQDDTFIMYDDKGKDPQIYRVRAVSSKEHCQPPRKWYLTPVNKKRIINAAGEVIVVPPEHFIGKKEKGGPHLCEECKCHCGSCLAFGPPIYPGHL